ncbi:carbon storage regulator CsrA [Cellulomonas endometrii]|uniref:carbon storage regulator CsrA n=1 Tax=Cellulomonas endometrii TaxID=3036301 RepID=UPI0031F87A0C
MLVLSRRVGERLVIGDDIVVTVIEVRSDGVRLGIDAPRSVSVHRAEVLEAVTAANVAASDAGDDAVESLRGLLAPAGDDDAPPAERPAGRPQQPPREPHRAGPGRLRAAPGPAPRDARAREPPRLAPARPARWGVRRSPAPVRRGRGESPHAAADPADPHLRRGLRRRQQWRTWTRSSASSWSRAMRTSTSSTRTWWPWRANQDRAR